jgi:bifunctional DNA-binding transcriptional regulator/antitoxin component of YhaV-PrlF toxin-antitoxin module
MSNTTYTLKISPQGQVTLPKALREFFKVRPGIGSRLTAVTTEDGEVTVSAKYPIEKHFGKYDRLWTQDGEDAAEYIRKLRNAMQPKL